MAHSTSALLGLQEPELGVANDVDRIADRLIEAIGGAGGDNGASSQGLLERALSAAAEAEQRLAEQTRRIAVLEALTFTDEATGLSNRRGFDRELKRLLANTRRYGDFGALMLVDLDDLKSINDIYGRLAGDRVLRSVGQMLLLQVRECDSIARVGGDEFALLLTKCDLDNARRRAEEMEALLNGRFVNFGDASIPVHGTVATTTYDQTDSVASLLMRADEAMHNAKAARGRGGNDHVTPLMFYRPRDEEI